ncbi:glycosyltransferase family 2 protein [Acidipropionibacterium jensenii]|uniref:glycosyltransferase family 2 protein n=1 Tax=Acidipropionibacterium jensenii TaxID=1749 RepID=UPI000FD80C47|nr:glycosyltransferase family 2 protein [Acidipropionibacterium jensenii]
MNELLRSLIPATEKQSTYVTIVDNSENEYELDKLNAIREDYSKAFSEISVKAAPVNLGYAAGHNLAQRSVGKGRCAIRMLLNPDVRILRGTIKGAISELTKTRSNFASVETVEKGITTDGEATMELLTSRTRPNGHAVFGPRQAYPGGHCLLVTDEAWFRLCGLNESYFLYCEEIDLTLRAKRAGLDHSSPIRALAVQHEGGGTTKTSDGELGITATYHSARSRIILYRSFHNLWPFIPSVVAARSVLAGIKFWKGFRCEAMSEIKGMAAGFRWRGEKTGDGV